MTFFVPEVVAGRLALGSEARLVLDTVPDHVIPARVSFVASQAQFTPKTVETASERQKLMFRVRAQIPPALLERYLEQVKTGVPGVAWLKLDADAPWPPELAVSDQLLKLLADERLCRPLAGRASGLWQDAGTGWHRSDGAGRLHGRPARPGRSRQVQPAGADLRLPAHPAGQCAGARR